MIKFRKLILVLLLCFIEVPHIHGEEGRTETVPLDLCDAQEDVFKAELSIPVKPGLLTLAYPEWTPGDHPPTGLIGNRPGLVMTANDQTLQWSRDLLDMFAFHLIVPQGVDPLHAKLDFLAFPSTQVGATPAGASVVIGRSSPVMLGFPSALG